MSEEQEKNNNIKLSNARLIAYYAIAYTQKNKIYAREAINKILKKYDNIYLSSQDRAFASKLSLGVAQTVITLDYVIKKCVKSYTDIKPNIMNALRISAYEIIYLEKENHVAVSQGVELIKYIEPKAKGLANFILRGVVREKKNFPYGNPDTDIEAFSRIYSIHKWQCELIINSIGERYGRSLVASCNGRPSCYIFINFIKTNTEEMLALFKENNVKAHIVKGLCGLKLHGSIYIENPALLMRGDLKKAYDDGKFLIADIASQAIVHAAILCSKTTRTVLDVCSGKGNKMLMLQSLAFKEFKRQLDITTLDNKNNKTEILKFRTDKFGTKTHASLTTDASKYEILLESLKSVYNDFKPSFDLVFVDSPCSGLGTLKRHPEIKSRLQPEDIISLANQSLQILKNSSKFVNLGGHLVYSTCTVTKEENEIVCKKFLESKEGKNFKILQFNVDNSVHDYFTTQTFSGLNDVHFCATFVKIN